MPDGTIRTVAILGLGLIGGSFGLALRKAGFQGEIIGSSEPPYMLKALAMGVVSSTTENVQEAAQRADLIYLAHKVDSILTLLDEIGSVARPGCLITDSGSTKSVICEKAERVVKHAAFVGGHPMAGKEKRGIENAEADLFRERCYVLTHVVEESSIFNEFKWWLKQIGARITIMKPSDHDQAVAFTSHLPQLLSTALAATLQNNHKDAFATVYGPGLLDMTRLALSSPDLWNSILETNKTEVLNAVNAYITTLNITKEKLLTNQLDHIFTSASKYAQKLREADQNTFIGDHTGPI